MDREYSAFILMHSLMMMTTYCLAMKPTNNIATDESALLALKAHITSDPLQILSKNWSFSSSSSISSSSVCDWVGVRCGSRHRRVTALNISNMGFTGTVPSHLGNLSFLVSLDLQRNYFHGTLPRELSRLGRIRFVILGQNNFSGPVPTWFGPKLQILTLNDNDFSGVIPSSISNLSKLENLDFEGNSLTGKIPEEIGNLRSLRILSLRQNRLAGSIPSAIFNISTLEIVGLTFNNLTGSLPDDICLQYLPSLKGLYLSANQLSGQIPSSLSRCSHLQILSLAYNRFSGFIPKELGSMEMLEALYLGGNNLQGVIPREIGNLRNLKRFAIERNRISESIPKEIGNLTKLTLLNLGGNFLTGAIPEEVGNLQKLEILYALFNYLNGSIPIGIFNLSTLSVVSLGGNHLTGNLPSNIGYQLPNLERFDLDSNNISGVIPASIVNCSKLNILLLGPNQFTGSIPKSLGNLELLEVLSLSDNHLTGDPTSSELDFLTSLTKCKSLTILVLSGNALNGMLPNSIGNLSTSLHHFIADRTKIGGPIPSEIGNLSRLILISLQKNQLTGPIPRSVQYLQNLQGLYLSQNKLKGTLDEFCNMHRLADLYLSQNQVSGPIPECFGNMTSLRSLYLDDNLLTSSIPTSLWKLSDLGELVLASNSFNGSLPPEIGNLKAAISMDLSMNQISGAIPSSLGDLQNLQNLSLANNQLQGSIPESMGKMLSLTSLNLSHNNLSGLIPKSLEALQYLEVFDVSSNHLSGEIPSRGPFRNFTSESFSSNDALCGDPKFQIPQCQTNKKHKLTVKRVLLLTLIPLVIAILVVILAFAYIVSRHRRKNEVPSAEDLSAVPTKERISYCDLLQATNRYSESNFLGSGSFGSVFKGILNDGKFVAVKVFILQLEGSLKSFDVECEVLCKLRHRNLVQVITSCCNQDFKALVLEYMPNGSLEKWLHSDQLFLNTLQRLNIMIDAACALQYLHQEYFTPVIHCDLKPSNILIDEELVAHVSDFGIAKFLGKDESFALTKTLATIGYIAPEYGREGRVSKACDVYSFGILLMEVFTGRRPNDEIFGENLNLKSWVNDSMPNSVAEVVDANLLNANEEQYPNSNSNETLECLSLIMELALNCVPESPKERVTMSEVVDSLKKIKVRYASCHGGGR